MKTTVPTVLMTGALTIVSLLTSGCSEPTDAVPVRERAGQEELRTEVAQMADDFVARRPMRGFLHDMPLSSAYYWQDVFADEAKGDLGRVIGYKTGGHDPGPGFPIFPSGGIRGAILHGMLRESGATVSLEETRRGFLEADFAVRVGSSSINSASTDLEILAGIDAIIPFAEIPDPYYEEGTRSINGTIAANMGSRYSFAGEALMIDATNEWLERLDNFTFAVHDERGNEIDRGAIKGWYRPVDVIRWLRDHLIQGGKRLQKGDLLSLGNIGIIRQLHADSPRGPAYQADEFILSYYGLSEDPVTVSINIAR